MKNFEEIYEKIRSAKMLTAAVAAAEDDAVLSAVTEAKKLGLCDSILVGDADKINDIAERENFDISSFRIVDEKDTKKSAAIATGLVRNGEADILMKGLIDTATLLRAVLNKENGLRTGGLISHIGVFELEGYDRLILVTDAAFTIAPTLSEKKSIIENAVNFMHSLGIEVPKVAPLCAVEVVNEAMPATIDAAMLSKMNDRGQIKGCIVDGPLAFDNAMSEEAAKHKGIKSPVAGKADILVVPNIETGNVLYKSFVYTTECKNGAVLLGAKAPVVLTSRADTFETKVNSMALAVMQAMGTGV
ncbi:MAG: phosphate butyryltransferase [Clostridia bacterium]|nr:phosphate butyryltransferase [Clostridia bacterium]NCC69803.1 phosphate butyryltransferase [Clostridia bacterium]